MANLAGVTPVFSVTLELAALDTNLTIVTRTKTLEFNPVTVTTYDEANTATLALITDLDAANECDVLNYWITGKYVGDAANIVSVGNPYKEAVITLNPLGGGDRISHTIFAPIDAMIAGKNVIETSALLLAYLDNFETGGDFRMSDGEAISATNQIAASRTRSVSSGKNYG